MNKLHALAIIVALGSSGCIPFWLFDDDDDDAPTAAPRDPIPTPQPTDTTPPAILSVAVPEWPPIGVFDLVPITVSDDIGLAELQVQLGSAPTFTTQLFGLNSTTQLRGGEIGEGYGTLTVTVVDQAGLSASKEVENVLVDLSAPEITLGNTVIRADAELEIWVADAWVLGGVNLMADSILVHEFPQTYPATLGIEWDYAMVSFAAADLPLGMSSAAVTAYDAAGNSVIETFTLVVDGEAPTVQITAPGEGATVTGLFDVTIDAQDDLSGPPQLTLTLDSVPAAMVSGPSATVQLDASALATGTHTLEAIATDGAGNVSAPAVVHIDVP